MTKIAAGQEIPNERETAADDEGEIST